MASPYPARSPKFCLMCGKPIPKGRRKYCGDDCSYAYWQTYLYPLQWGNARAVALKRANGRCLRCGSTTKIRAHHIIPLEPGEPRHNSPKNRQENLMALCRPCHEKEHHPPKASIPDKSGPSANPLPLPLFEAAGVKV